MYKNEVVMKVEVQYALSLQLIRKIINVHSVKHGGLYETELPIMAHRYGVIQLYLA